LKLYKILVCIKRLILKETDESFIYTIKTKWLEYIQKLKKEIDFSSESPKDETDINNLLEEINIYLSEVQSSTSNETLINSGTFNNDFDFYGDSHIQHHRNSKYLSANLFQKKKSIDFIKEQIKVKQFNLFCESEQKVPSEPLGENKNNEIVFFGISKNKGENNMINNFSNNNYIDNDSDCFAGVNEFIINKNKEDFDSLNIANNNLIENKESCGKKISKISKIINENLCDSNLVNNNFNNNNFKLENNNNFKANLIQAGNFKNNDNYNINKISPSKNQISNLKNTCKYKPTNFKFSNLNFCI
jgi:hypothetical protein